MSIGSRFLYITVFILLLPLAPFFLLAYLCHHLKLKSTERLMLKQLLIYKQRGQIVLPGVLWNTRNSQQ